jgi:hypothetical protein
MELFSRVREYDKLTHSARFYSTRRLLIPRTTGERCRDSTAIHTFLNDEKYVMKTMLVPTRYRDATEELGKVGARVFPDKSPFAVPLDIDHAIVDEIHR